MPQDARALRRLFPTVADVDVDDACSAPRPRPAGRPYVMLCMIQSIDGSTSLGGNSRRLGGPVDQQMLLTLRTKADAIVVGAATVRADDYGPPRTGQHVYVVSRRAEFDFHNRLWSSGRATLVIPADVEPGELPVPTIRAGHGSVDIAAALGQMDAAVVQAEGGPSLNAMLAEADLLDELNLTWSPLVAGGDGARAVRGAPEVDRRMRLTQVCEADDGFLFARYMRELIRR